MRWLLFPVGMLFAGIEDGARWVRKRIESVLSS